MADRRARARCASSAHCAGDSGQRSAAARPRRPGPAGGCWPSCSTRRVPVAARSASAVRLPPRPPLPRGRGRAGDHRLRAGRVDHADVRRQLQLARPGLVPAELPAGHARCERYHRFYGDDFTIEYPTGSGQRLHPGRGRRRPVGPADLHLHSTGRTAGGRCFGGDRAAAERPAPGTTTCSSTSTSTATPAPGSAPPTRPAGPALVADLIRRGTGRWKHRRFRSRIKAGTGDEPRRDRAGDGRWRRRWTARSCPDGNANHPARMISVT